MESLSKRSNFPSLDFMLKTIEKMKEDVHSTGRFPDARRHIQTVPGEALAVWATAWGSFQYWDQEVPTEPAISRDSPPSLGGISVTRMINITTFFYIAVAICQARF